MQGTYEEAISCINSTPFERVCIGSAVRHLREEARPANYVSCSQSLLSTWLSDHSEKAVRRSRPSVDLVQCALAGLSSPELENATAAFA